MLPIHELEPYITGADYLDVKYVDGTATLREFLAGMLSYYPWWIVWLYRVRKILVRVLGLVRHEAPEILPSFTPEEIPFTPGESASFFIVRHAMEGRYWVSETPGDKHLAAYLGVIAEPPEDGRTRFVVFTSIRYLHWTGPVYFNLIRPFHHLVVWKMMLAGSRSRSVS
jgi:hypothetical protein